MHGFYTRAMVKVSGYTGGAAELRYTPKGQEACELSLAVGGDKEKGSTWYQVPFYGADAVAVCEKVDRAGMAVVVEGLQEVQKFVNKNTGRDGFRLRIHPDSIMVMRSPAEGESIPLVRYETKREMTA